MFVSKSHVPFLFIALTAVGTSMIPLQPLSAQTQAINGSIRGRVADVAASAVPQAKVTIVNEQIRKYG